MQGIWIGILIGLGWCFGGQGGQGEPLTDSAWQALLPKREVGVLRVLEEHPHYDGRGVVVAVFDTGVDPGAAGLQVTSDGKPKIIDLIDASGSGDVAMELEARVEEGRLQGGEGLEMEWPADWENPSGRVYVGVKRAYELYPKGLVRQLRERAKEDWMERQRKRLRDLHEEMSSKEGEEKKEWKARISQLEKLMEDYQDPGPQLYCVSFHDGEAWRAAVDTDADGEWSDEKAMRSYRDGREYATFESRANLNFAVNVYDEGKLLSIVTDAGMHGTHVAGIVAAHFPDAPERSGVAPGAQVVSVKIGDTRLDGMETSTGIERGLKAVLDHGCDLVNMSYGEPSARPDEGWIIGAMNELVREHGVLFVASAGNDGPALSTVGAPGGVTSGLIGVGAYVSEEMMRVQYSLAHPSGASAFTWSSRGPAYDGDLGVDICAPGAAISSVPNWTLQRSQLANGTSMAAPSACGGLALVLSGLKAEGIEYTPWSVRQAVRETAKALEGVEVFAQGQGLVQVDKALQHHREQAKKLGALPEFEVEVKGASAGRGIYIRNRGLDPEVPLVYSVAVRPRFAREAPDQARIDLELLLEVEASVPWIEAPELLVLPHGGRIFKVAVKANELEAGVHFGEVELFDRDNRELGALVRVPVTVVVPEREGPVGEGQWRERMAAGEIRRHFLAVPLGAGWTELKLRFVEGNERCRFMVHALQPRPGSEHRADGKKWLRELSVGEVWSERIAAEAGGVLELAVGPFWSEGQEVEVEISVEFGGIWPEERRVALRSDELAREVRVWAFSGDEILKPEARLEVWQRVLVPEKAAVRPLPEDRDWVVGEGPSYELVLEYGFEQREEGRIVPRVPALQRRLYDAEVGSQLWMLFDENKQLLAVDDAWPEPVLIEKGKHVLRYHFRHHDPAVLDKLRELRVEVETRLGKVVPVTVTRGLAAAAAVGKGGSVSRRLGAGTGELLSLQVPKVKELPEFVRAGDVLSGWIRFQSGDEARPGGYPLSLLVTGQREAETERGQESEGEKKCEGEEAWGNLQEKILRAKKRGDGGKGLELTKRAVEEHKDVVEAWVARLHALDNEDRKERLDEVVAAADAVLQRVDETLVARGMAWRKAPEFEDEKEWKEEAKEAKQILLDALYRKGRALAFMDLPEEDEEGSSSWEDGGWTKERVEEEFEKNFAELARWTDTTDAENFLLHIRRERRHGRYGQALEVLEKHMKRAPAEKLIREKRQRIFEEMGWEDWAAYDAAWLEVRFPAGYPRF